MVSSGTILEESHLYQKCLLFQKLSLAGFPRGGAIPVSPTLLIAIGTLLLGRFRFVWESWMPLSIFRRPVVLSPLDTITAFQESEEAVTPPLKMYTKTKIKWFIVS